ncbi:carboxypeptidase regulatory-like domain-containing protein [Aquimarina sediminis]|uniref:carboxypeptidase regulatory-like domain-containing protein n=1 Tax=Aquimarina sediminis TaxID=2070536 RepID=UPI000CA01953|nr:carboxypeptidase regulatory-like domain-containing protein [Aquimarina sediminis]
MKEFIIRIISVFVILATASCSEDTIDSAGLGSVKGKVVKVGTNEPIENVKISTNPSSSTVFTDEDGVYKLDNVPSGEYSLSAQKEGLLAVFKGITVLSDIELEVVLEMEVEAAGNRPPVAATLVTPVDNTIDLPLEVKLIWTASDPDEDNLTYKVSLRNENSADVEVFEDVTDTTYTVSGLSYSTKYFWQVIASDGINPEVNSAIFAFKTAGPPNNRIVFTKLVGDNSVIYSSDESGGTQIPLTSTSKNSFRPRRNVATKKIAFLQSIGSQTHLFTMNEDGSQVKQVTSTVGVSGFNLEEIDFSWDAGGAKLLFPSQDKLYSINADGSGLSLVYQTTGDLITEVDKNDSTGITVLKTNDHDGYAVQIFTIDGGGAVQDVILTGQNGAAGSVNLSVDGTKLLYSRDMSGSENINYRQLDSRIFIYDFGTTVSTDLSTGRSAGTNDLDARFSPNEASVIFVNTSNDGISVKNIQTVPIGDLDTRTTVLENAEMPDWE